MKKKTLLVLLILAISMLSISLIFSIVNFASNIKFTAEHLRRTENGGEYYVYNYKWIELSAAEYRTYLISGVVKPILSMCFNLATVILFAIITITLIKREKLILTEEEKQEIKRKQTAKKKRDKILQLNAKIEKLKNEDDD